jgi:threonine dehydratase
VNLVAQLSEAERDTGVIVASTGNHGQSIAYASKLFGVKATVVMPENSNPEKVESMKLMGAEVVFYGHNYDDAKKYCEDLAEKRGYRYVHSGNEPHLVAGVGTEALEMLEECPQISKIIVPIGGGSGAAGCCIVAKAINPEIQVIGVQSKESPAAFESWKQRKLVQRPNETIIEGLSTGSAFEFPQRILQKHLDDFILVSDEDIMQAVIWMIRKAHTLAEGAGAAALAGAYKIRNRFKGDTLGIVCSGGNLSFDKLKRIIANNSP